MCRRWMGWMTNVVLVLWCGLAQGQVVRESAREIPIAHRVDVIVVGGGTGAVAAAVEAAEEGAQVFLAAPHPYLGEDMTATLRLWLESGEKPGSDLAQRLFHDDLLESADPNRLPFSYSADGPSSGAHKDKTPPSRLTDGKWSSASSESVQYDRDTQIVADLGSVQELRQVRLFFYRRRESAGDGTGFEVGQLTVEVSDDNRKWRVAGKIINDKPMEDVSRLSLLTEQKARYVRFSLKLPDGYQRMLLGEIEIVGPDKEVVGSPRRPIPPRPMHVKKELDDALLRAGVHYLYSCFATDVLRDQQGDLAGIVMANRAGRQAVIGKVLIDATPQALVAREAGVEFRGVPAKTKEFHRVVIGGPSHPAPGVEVREAAPAYPSVYPAATGKSTGAYRLWAYRLSLELPDQSYSAYMQADQQARTLTYDPEQQFTSDLLFSIPDRAIRGRTHVEQVTNDVTSLPLSVLQPVDADSLYVLGGAADVARDHVGKMLRPLAFIELGRRVGREAARKAKARGPLAGIHVSGSAPSGIVAQGDVREVLAGVRPTESNATIPQPERGLPVLGTWDVVVIGGGTGGAPAGIGAARQGVKTLVVEYLYGLGGVGTEGAISSYYWGNRVGFTATVLDGQTKWPIEPKKEWYRRQLIDAGADVWFGTIGCGAVVRDNRVIGAVVATPYGRGVVLAKTVIDSTGNSDIAAAAGAACLYTDATEFGMQGTGLPGRRLGGAYNNTDFTLVDETDMVDIWRMLVYSKNKYADAFDHGRLIDTRERRRIVGDYTVTVVDEMAERTYPDSVVRTWSNFDTHGFTIDPFFLLEHPEKVGIGVNLPMRIFLPKGLEGIVVTGLSMSAHRDALPLIRMQADIQNGGYAMGVAASMAAESGELVRKIDVKRLQKHLAKIGNLPETVLEDKDSFPLSDKQLDEAVEALKQGKQAAKLLTDPNRAVPRLVTAYRQAGHDDQLVYARGLAAMGNSEGTDRIIEEVRSTKEWDAGWNYRGMGQFGSAFSPLDILIVCLGRAGNPKAIPAIQEKLDLLTDRSEFSHHRAVGLALEMLRDPSAAEPLAQLLKKPRMTGFAQTDIEHVTERGVPGGTNAERSRRESLRELLLARALFRCGDADGLAASILEDYSHDLRGHLARHARAILTEGK